MLTYDLSDDVSESVILSGDDEDIVLVNEDLKSSELDSIVYVGFSKKSDCIEADSVHATNNSNSDDETIVHQSFAEDSVVQYSNSSFNNTIQTQLVEVTGCYTNVFSNPLTSDDVSVCSDSCLHLPRQVSRGINRTRPCSNEISKGAGIIKQSHIVLAVTIFISLVTSVSLLNYYNSERSIFESKILDLEATVLKLQTNDSSRAQSEQETANSLETVPPGKQDQFEFRLNQLLDNLHQTMETGIKDGKYVSALERKVLSLQDKIVLLQKEHATDLKEKDIQIQKLLEDVQKERLKSSRLEEREYFLKKRIRKLSKLFMSSEDKLNECTRYSCTTLNKKMKDFVNVMSKAGTVINDKILHDFEEIKNIVLNSYNTNSESAFKEGENEAPTSNNKNHDESENKSTRKRWVSFLEALTFTQDIVMDQMTKEYNDLKSWYESMSKERGETSPSTFNEESTQGFENHQNVKNSFCENKKVDVNSNEEECVDTQATGSGSENKKFYDNKWGWFTKRNIMEDFNEMKLWYKDFSKKTDESKANQGNDELKSDKKTESEHIYTKKNADARSFSEKNVGEADYKNKFQNNHWETIQETFAHAKGLVLDQVAQDFNDFKSIYNNIFQGNERQA